MYSNIQVVPLASHMIHSFLFLALPGANPYWKFFSVIQHTEHREWETHYFFFVLSNFPTKWLK